MSPARHTNELLLVSFGVGQSQVRSRTLDPLARKLSDAFPDYRVRQAFTSRMILDRLPDGTSIEALPQALERAARQQVRHLLIQPTQLTFGFDYDRVRTAAARYAGRFSSLNIGAPLLASPEDRRQIARLLVRLAAPYAGGGTAVCFMGHGSRTGSNAPYEDLGRQLPDGVFLGLMQGRPNVEDVLDQIRARGCTRAVLMPLLLTAGGHAARDLAGDAPHSWRSVFTQAGYPTQCVLRGLGELEPVRELFLAHARAAVPL